MSTALILNISITVFTTLSIATIAWWARKHPNRSNEYPERARMPKVLLILGWICVCVGLLMGLEAFSSDDARDPIAFRIASVAIFLGGMAFVAMYRNFYVAPRTYEVAFRSVLGKEHLLAYSGHRALQRGDVKGQQFLTVRSIHGVKLSLNMSAYDMTPLLGAIDFREVTGRWPVRPEVTTQDI